MAGLDLTAFDKMLKVMYSQKRIAEIVYNRFPLLNLLERMTAAGPGKSLDRVIRFGGTHNRSADYATARAGTAAPAYAKFSISVTQNFNYGFVDHQTILASKTDVQAFAQAVSEEVKGMLEAMTSDIAFSMYRSSTGTIGEIDSIDTSGNVIVFKNRYSVRTLGIGSVLGGSANADLSSPNANFLTVTAIDRDAGSVTYSGTDTSWVADYYVFTKGDANAKFKGLADWLPSGSTRAAALAASFFGQVRNVDSVRLGGICFDGSSMSTSAALTKVAHRLFEEQARPDICLMNPSDYTNLCDELQSRAVHATVSGQVANISYPGIKIHGLASNTTIMADADCPPGLAYMLDTSTWKIAHLGKELINTWNEDGLDLLRHSSSNGVEMSIYSYMQPFCDRPGSNAVIELA